MRSQNQTPQNKKATESASGLSTSERLASGEMVHELNELLANEYLLFTRTLNFHWNLVGARFHSVHVFLEHQYKEMLELMDDLAERIRYLDGRPLGTLKEMKAEASLTEDPGHVPSITRMLKELNEGHDAVNDQIQKLLEGDHFEIDKVTEDFLVGLQGKHQKMIWMLRSHLTEGSDNAPVEPSRHN